MSAEALLEDPALFVESAIYDYDYRYAMRNECNYTSLEPGPADSIRSFPLNCAKASATPHAESHTPTEFALEYLRWARAFPPSDFYKCVKAHVLKLVHRPLRLARTDAASLSQEGHGVNESTSSAASASATPAMTTTTPIANLEESKLDANAAPNTASAAGAIQASLLAATNEVELEASVHALDSYMRRRSSNVLHLCKSCNLSRVLKDEMLPSSAQSLSAKSPGTCACWRRETWYQRHRDQTVPAGGKKRQSESEASEHTGTGAPREEDGDGGNGSLAITAGAHRTSRKELKEMRRQKYKAMGYDV